MKEPHVPRRWSRLTKRDSLLLCEEEWIWQGENPYDLRAIVCAAYQKANWPRFKANGGDVPDWSGHFDCSCCVYANFQWSNDHSDCSRCPIPRSAWGSEDYDGIAPCEEKCDSPYRKWLNANTKKDRSKYAFAVAALARAELDKEA